MKNIIQNIKSVFALKPEASEVPDAETLKVLYRPAKSEEITLKGLNLYTVKNVEPLFTNGMKSGIVGNVEERDGEYRSFRFDRIVSMVEA
jgi:hypothetical protein